MTEPTQQQPAQPTPAGWVPVPGRILAEPATADTCAADLRTPAEQAAAAGAARSQFAEARMNAGEHS